MSAAEPARMPGVRLFGYALGSFGTGVFSTVPTVLLLYFCTQVLNIPAQYAAVVVFVPKAWAIVWDPLIGAWSDGARSAWGRRRPFLLVGGCGILIAFVGLFSWPYQDPETSVWIVGAFYFALATFYSVFAVPYVAFPAEASSDAKERERIVAWRIGLAMVGSLIGAALAPMLVEMFGGAHRGYTAMSVIVGIICGAGMGAAFLSMPSGASAAHAPQKRFSWGRVRDAALGDRDFSGLMLSYVLQLTGVGALSAMTPYWVTFVLQRPEADAGLFMGVLLLTTIGTTALWAFVVRRFGARAAIVAAAVIFALACASLIAVPAAGSAGFIAYAFIGGGFSGLQVAPFARAAHLVHLHALRTEERQEGLMTGIWTAAEKLGLAFGPGVAGLCLAGIGFVSATAQQAPATLGWMTVSIALIPAFFAAASLVPLLAIGAASAPMTNPKPTAS